MNLRRKTPSDSLYLLLDTLCNAFGGIILLAVLVVLLTSKVKNRPAIASDSHQMLQRRLALAQTNLQAAFQLSMSLEARAKDGDRQQQITLLATRKELQQLIRQVRELATTAKNELESANASDPAARLKYLNSELANTQARQLEVQNKLAGTQDKIKSLQLRLADMQRQLSSKLRELERPLRLPREHETGKRVIYIIAQYGHVYVCRNSDFSRNDTDIHWTSTLLDQTAEPIPGRGIDPAVNPTSLKAFLSSQSNEMIYFVFCVFEDSFPAFLRAKQIVMDGGFTYGWEPFRNKDGPVSFGSVGYTPKPQ